MGMIPGLDLYNNKERWKLLLFIIAIGIGVGSLLYTNKLVKELSDEEEKKVELWAEATQYVLDTKKENVDLNFLLKVIENNTTIPVILADENNKILYFRNIDSVKAKRNEYLIEQIGVMKKFRMPLTLKLENGKRNYIYYHESIILEKLTIYPYIQLSVILVFVVVSYLAFSFSRRAEQNKVWLGMSRETAHQLGTPTSSLMAWVELLKEKNHDSDLVMELEKDVIRLNIITERFSKIGSKPRLENFDLYSVISESVGYMQKRVPSSVNLQIVKPHEKILVAINKHLFGWVLENLIKNALDAVVNTGFIEIKLSIDTKKVIVDVSDNGKGISKGNFKRVFKPGFTSKTRGWGLGLSLTKRIIEEYHHGKIFVLHSEINKGTTFRMILPIIKQGTFPDSKNNSDIVVLNEIIT